MSKALLAVLGLGVGAVALVALSKNASAAAAAPRGTAIPPNVRDLFPPRPAGNRPIGTITDPTVLMAASTSHTLDDGMNPPQVASVFNAIANETDPDALDAFAIIVFDAGFPIASAIMHAKAQSLRTFHLPPLPSPFGASPP